MKHILTIWITWATASTAFAATGTGTGTEIEVRDRTSACGPHLTTRVALGFPPQLKLSREVVAFAMQTPDWARLLTSLSRIYALLTPPRMNQLGHRLRPIPPADLEMPESPYDNPFLDDRRELITPSVEHNFKTLFHTFYGWPINAYDLGLMAVLFKGVNHVEIRSHRADRLSDTEWAEMKTRYDAVLGKPAYREVLAGLLDDQGVRRSLIAMWNDTPGARSRRIMLTPTELDQVRARIRRRAPGPNDLIILKHVLNLTSLQIGIWARDQGLMEHGFTATHTVRRGFLELSEMYYTVEPRPGFAVADLIDVFDHLYFAAPLPTDPNELYNMVLEQSRQLLLPMKSAYARSLARAPEPVTVTTAEPPTVNLIDFFAPPPPATRRASRTRAPFAAASTAEPEETLVNPLTDRTELAAYVTYEFKFRRNPAAGVQRVVFGPSVIVWFDRNPTYRRSMLNALLMGWAVNFAGMKELWTPKGFAHGRVIEIKAQGSYRGLALTVDGVWQIVTIEHKDDVRRAMENLAPL